MKKAIRLLFAVALVATIASCSTTKGFPQRMSSDDCLVVIRTTIQNDDDMPVARRYFFQLSGDYPIMRVTGNSDGFVVARIRESGVSITGISSDISIWKNVTGDSFSAPLSRALPYKPGEVVVADFSFVQVLTKTGYKTFSNNWQFAEMSKEEKDALVERLRALKRAESWFVDPTL